MAVNINSFEQILEELKQKISNFEHSILERNKYLNEVLESALKNIEKFESSWNGSWIKGETDLYFNNRQEVSDYELLNLIGISNQLKKITNSDIEKYIEESSKFQIELVRQEICDMIEQAKEICDDFCIELSLIKTQENFADEVKNIDELEQFKWGVLPTEYIEIKRPKTIIGNITDFQKGFDVPPHIKVQATIIYLLTANSSLIDFIKKSKKLIRKIQIKHNLLQEQPSTINTIENVLKICDSFHNVAKQLRQRHSDRNTLIIDDEYDVQDLFHALLKIFFEDIRAEDSTPNHAGSCSRVDFLLPQENIVIEIKKTRKGLEAKEIGNQLSIDVIRYRSHPNCKNLIFFVYDPEGKIGNPKGLENDLNNLSDDNINIITLIRPI